MSRKKDLKQPDQIQTAMERALTGASENLVPILSGLGIVFLVTLIGIGVSHYSERELEKTNLYYARASRMVAEGMAGPVTDTHRFDEAEKLLDLLYREARGTDIYPFVLARLADIYTTEKKYKEAMGALNELVELSGVDPLILDAAYFRLVKLNEADYNIPEALRLASKAVETVPGPFSALLQKDVERLRSGSLNPQLTDELKAERISAEDLAPKAVSPLNLPAK